MGSKKRKIQQAPVKLPWAWPLVTLVALILCAFHINSLLSSAREVSFSQDDLQHVHIAWNVFRGKVIFKDFYEHHGPLYAWLNSLFLHLKFGAVESVETLTYLRFFQVVVAGLCALAVGLSAIKISPPIYRFPSGAISGALFLSLSLLQGAGFQTRPDIYVGFFSGLFLLCLFSEKRWLAGVSLGLAIAFHPKFLPINLGFLVADQLGQRFRPSQNGRYHLLIGEAVLLAVVGVALAIQGAFFQAIRHMFFTNVTMVSRRMIEKSYIIGDLFKWFWRLDPIFLTLLLILLASSLYLFLKQKNFRSYEKLFLILSTLGCVLFLLGPVHEYALLLVAPLMVVFVVKMVMEMAPEKMKSHAVLALLALTIAVTVATQSGKEKTNARARQRQEESLRQVLVKLDRSTPVFYVWFSRCASYVFNEDSKSDWMRSPRVIDEENDVLPGFPVSPQEARRNLENPRNRFEEEGVKYVAIDDAFVGRLSRVERSYLEANFTKSDCWWEKK